MLTHPDRPEDQRAQVQTFNSSTLAAEAERARDVVVEQHHRVVAGASHSSLLFTGRDAAASSVALAEVLSSVRTGQHLYP
jgi:hypothetical protein